MTTDAPKRGIERFEVAKLPWLIAAIALLAFLLTLNHWISVENLPQLVSVEGLNWQLQYHSPLLYILTFPVRWLPPAWQPLGLNVFAAICAALTLAQLARSVALLPHDRTHEERQRERGGHSLLTIPTAWIPPVLAVLVCGLQLTFWENATDGTGEMLDLLAFAFVIRCLLEHRIRPGGVWITRFALVYGLAIPNNWAMIGFAPAFLAALIWMNGLRFFRGDFLMRLFLFGSIGLLLYLFFPILHLFSDGSHLTFWQVLKANLASQKNILLNYPRSTVVLLGLTSLLPILIIGFRWTSFSGDMSGLSQTVGASLFNIVHAMFLGACLWVAFDPVFSPRSKGYGLSFLSFYYLGALAIGYYSGYFLLLGSRETTKQRIQSPGLVQLLKKVLIAIIVLVSMGVPAGLAWKNGPRILARNQPTLEKLAAAMAKTLPKEKAVVLSDDQRRSFVLKAWLAKEGRSDDYLILDTAMLKLPDYHAYLLRTHVEAWSPFQQLATATNLLGDVNMMQVVKRLSHDFPIWYLQPSFGYYFEIFQLRPRGLVYELRPYGTNSVLPDPLSEEEVRANESFWTEEQADLFDDLPKLKELSDKNAALASHFGSIAANYWGCCLQKREQFTEAEHFFTTALKLNQENLAAQVNLEYNQKLQDGIREGLDLPPNVEDKFGRYRTWDQVIAENGPFDEPNFCFRQAVVYGKGNLRRQATRQFYRVVELNPDNIIARLRYAHGLLSFRRYDLAKAELETIRGIDEVTPLSPMEEVNLIVTEASMAMSRTNQSDAREILEQGVSQYPTNLFMLDAATQFYLGQSEFTNALELLKQETKLVPDSAAVLVNLAAMHIRLQQFERALPALNRALVLQPGNRTALLNRAIAHLQLEDLDAAQLDYEQLLESVPESPQALFGLAEVAYRKDKASDAIKYYRAFLKLPRTNPQEAALARKRLEELAGTIGKD